MAENYLTESDVYLIMSLENIKQLAEQLVEASYKRVSDEEITKQLNLIKEQVLKERKEYV
tara:strand:+ start:3201 stop:3380 length:180 start_codon:yes stop_codon:yes gene_type:complete